MRLNEISDPITASAILPRDAVPAFQAIMAKVGGRLESVLNLPEQEIPVAIDPGALDLLVRAMTRHAIDHCDDQDAVRLWMRRADGHVLIVVDFSGTRTPETPGEDVMTAASGEATGWRILSGLKLIEFIADEHQGVAWSEKTIVGGKHVGGLVVVCLHPVARS